MTDTGLREPIRRVTALERADEATAAPGVSAGHQGAGEQFKILDLESESAKWVAGEGIEACRNEDEVGYEPSSRGVEGALERLHVFGARQSRRLGDVPDGAMGPAIVGGPGPRIPRPLVHRDEMDVGLILHERLGAIAVMDVPIGDQNAREPVLLSCVVGREGDISEKAESHGAVANRVMPRRPHRGKAAWVDAAGRKIDAGKNATRSGRRRIP